LSEGDVWLPKLFRQTVPQHWPGSGDTAVAELVPSVEIGHILSTKCM